MNWDFYVLELMGFGEQRRRWIKFGTSQVCVLYLVYLGNKQEVPSPMEEVQKDNSEMVNEAPQD